MPGSWIRILFLPLALNNRLADAELIDAVANRFQRLIDGVVAQGAQLFFVEGQIKIGRRRPLVCGVLASTRLPKSLFKMPRTRSALAADTLI